MLLPMPRVNASNRVNDDRLRILYSVTDEYRVASITTMHTATARMGMSMRLPLRQAYPTWVRPLLQTIHLSSARLP